MNLCLETSAWATICLVIIVVRAFIKKRVSQNSCTTWQWLYCM